MSNPLIRAFFLGRATAEVLSEEIEHQFTDVLSNVGKFDAEQRERLRQFTQQVMDRADVAASRSDAAAPTDPASTVTSTTDLQETIDDLRAEIAQLRSALQSYRNTSG